MRIASVTLPVADNDGNSLADAHAALRSSLAEEFGGFTAINATGGWCDPSTGKVYVESVIRYDVAMEDSAVNRAKLADMATFYGHMARQIAMMITHAAGDVAFIETLFVTA